MTLTAAMDRMRGVLWRSVSGALIALTVLLGGATTNALGQCQPGAWVSGIGTPGLNGDVYRLAVLPGGDVIVGGEFREAGGIEATNLARYNPATRVWSAVELGPEADLGFGALAALPSGDLIVGGRFTTAGGVAARHIARYNPATGAWSALGAGVSDAPSVFAVLPDGDVIVGGHFSTAGGRTANNIARVNPATGVWSTLGSGILGASFTQVGALTVLPGGDVIAAGRFSSAGGVAANNIARYNPATGVWSNLGSGVNGEAFAVAVLPSGDVIVGGEFTMAGEVAVNKIARYSTATGEWSALGLGFQDYGWPWSLAVLPGGDVIVGGYFTTVGGIAASNIVRYNPGTDVWCAMGLGTSGDGYTLAVLPGGDVVVGGFFYMAGGVTSNYIARYSFGESAPNVTAQPQDATACHADSAAFSVTAIGADPLSYQWRRGAVAISPIANPSAATAALILSNVHLADAGSYDCIVTNAFGSATSDPATLTVCIGDFNCDGGIDGGDVESFFAAWEVGDAAADVNEDGAVNGADVEFFFVRWEGGC